MSLYFVHHQHSDETCPARDPQMGAMLLTHINPANARTYGVDLISDAVREVNANLPEGGRIRAFVLMPREFDADEAEMTRSRKLKRQVLLDKYDALVAALYSQQETVGMQSTVTYQDGTSAMTENDLRVVRIA